MFQLEKMQQILNIFLDNKQPENAKIFLDIIKTSKPTPVTINYREITDKLKKDMEARFN